MDLTSRPFRIFVAIADMRSFSRAAEKLNISQPALSSQVRELERQLGFSLFNRTTRKVHLTREGQVFLDYARRIILESDWVLQAAEAIRARPLMIGVPHYSQFMPYRVKLTDEYLLTNPGMPIRIVARHPRQLAEELSRDALDAIILLDINGNQNESLFSPLLPDTKQIPLGAHPIQIAVPEEDELSAKPVLGKRELQGREILTFTKVHGIDLVETVVRNLLALDAKPEQAAEGDALSVARLGAKSGTLAIDLGWFEPLEGVRKIPVEWELSTGFRVAARQSNHSVEVQKFLAFCDQFNTEPTA